MTVCICISKRGVQQTEKASHWQVRMPYHRDQGQHNKLAGGKEHTWTTALRRNLSSSAAVAHSTAWLTRMLLGSAPVSTGARLRQKGAQGDSASWRSTITNSSSSVSRGRRPSAASAPPCRTNSVSVPRGALKGAQCDLPLRRSTTVERSSLDARGDRLSAASAAALQDCLGVLLPHEVLKGSH